MPPSSALSAFTLSCDPLLTPSRYARVIDDNREIIGYDPSSANKRLPQETPPPTA